MAQLPDYWWSIIYYFIASFVMCCIPRPDALMRQDRKDKDANASDVEESVIPVVTATDTTDNLPPSPLVKLCHPLLQVLHRYQNQQLKSLKK